VNYISFTSFRNVYSLTPYNGLFPAPLVQ